MIINCDFIHLRNRIHRSNLNCQESHIITKSSDSVDLRYRLFSNSDNLREQSRDNRASKEFSVSRSNQAHRYSNSFHQKKSDRRIDRFSVHTHRSDDSR